MKKYFAIIYLFELLCLSPHVHAAMGDYCQNPPFISSVVQPNLLLAVDISASMMSPAYNYGSAVYDPTKTYEGYFDPSKYYKLVGGVYEETTSTGVPCSCSCTSWKCRPFDYGGCVKDGGGCSKWGCCEAQSCTGDCNMDSGNHLNFLFMRRIDLVRWVMTGGTPSSCTNAQTFNNGYCDPELWNESGNESKVGAVCNNSLDVNGDDVADGGCTLRSYDGTLVKVRWNRVNAGLAFQFKDLPVRPRMGAMFFYMGAGMEVKKVYMGDFLAQNSTSDNFPYMNLITYVNSVAPSGMSPVGPALRDVLNYFSQTPPQYGGFPEQSGDGDKWKNPMYICDGGGSNCTSVPCAQNYVLLLSDGEWGAVGDYEDQDPVKPAREMHMGFTNIKTGIKSKIDEIYSVGLFSSGVGREAMKYIAMYGSFDNTVKTWPDAKTGYPSPNSKTAFSATSSPDWDVNPKDNLPDTFFSANSALEIKNSIIEALLRILERVSSGTAASMLSSSEGSGANLLQAVFYPQKSFVDESVSWTGEMQNLWYFIDPNISNSTIREDTVSDYKLGLTEDNVIQFYFDPVENKTKVKRYLDTDGNGAGDTYVDSIGFDDIHSLWKAGELLHARNLTTSPRSLYTNVGGRINFSVANAGTLKSYLGASDVAEATNIIKHIHGFDQSGYRSRTATNKGTLNTWKLGDIISSTPKVLSSVALNRYNKSKELKGYGDSSYQDFIDSAAYKTRGTVFAGANDGMLHAFKLGTLYFPTSSYKAQLCDDTNGNGKCDDGETSTANLGQEQWGFIPQNALPYLKYLADPNYCHLYYVDAPTYIFDSSINVTAGCSGTYDTCNKKVSSWRTILVGGMGLGGACKDAISTCTNCVKTPQAGLGYSSYYALDITDPENPQLLWEFSNPALGFSTSGPAIVRIGDKDKNGKWFAIFASGPTGPIDTTYRQFLGKSDQNLKLFVLDLKTGALVRAIDTGIPEAFAGSLNLSTMDADLNYSDDIFYLGYVKKSGSTWTDGGILRVITKEDNDPSHWSVSKVIDGIGPVTASISKLQDRTNKVSWLYWGSGRYYYKASSIDDMSGQRAIYGLQEPCYTTGNQIDKTCTTTLALADLQDQTTTPSTSLSAGKKGWYITLDNPPATGYGAERVITNPSAGSTGVVFFTTFAPSTDMCSMGGYSYLWSVKWDTGYTASALFSAGKALIQVSTGEIKEIALNSAFTEKSSRRSVAIKGVPPQGQGIALINQPRPLKKVLHIREK